jgi:hypothetical protein
MRPAYSANVAIRTCGYPTHSLATAGMTMAMAWSPGRVSERREAERSAAERNEAKRSGA